MYRSNHPLAKQIAAVFGDTPQLLREPVTVALSAEVNEPDLTDEVDVVSTAVSGASPYGTRFNLEPRANAVPQTFPAVDYIPNGAGAGVDLVVGTAYDRRGFGVLEGSTSGYYVSRDGDNAPEFEGALPPVGDPREPGTFLYGSGIPDIVADPAHDAFIAVDVRWDASTSAIGVFRTTKAKLLDQSACPNGTHTAFQAARCWETKRLVWTQRQPFPNEIFALADRPKVVIDSRTLGLGAGNVYITAVVFDVGLQQYKSKLLACTNTLSSCSSSWIMDAVPPDFDLRVRPDGRITLAWEEFAGTNHSQLKYLSCDPNGAPSRPICGTPVLVQDEFQPPAQATNHFLVRANPHHDHRVDANGTETYYVWSRCKVPPSVTSIVICPDQDVVMKVSKDNGLTWSAIICVACEPEDQFIPAIRTDASRNIVSIVYYSSCIFQTC
jgi:hypothetical protein